VIKKCDEYFTVVTVPACVTDVLPYSAMSSLYRAQLICCRALKNELMSLCDITDIKRHIVWIAEVKVDLCFVTESMFSVNRCGKQVLSFALSYVVPLIVISALLGLANKMQTSTGNVPLSTMTSNTETEAEADSSMNVTGNKDTAAARQATDVVAAVAIVFAILWLPIKVYTFDAHCCHMDTAIRHPVPDRVEPSFVIFDIRAL